MREIPPLKFIPDYEDKWGDKGDVIVSDDWRVYLWFRVGAFDPDILRLFAAAPELLAACETFANCADTTQSLRDMIAQAQIAIHKAKGES